MYTDYVLLCGWFYVFCRGLGNFRNGSAPLELGGAHHLFDKIPNLRSKMPKSLVSASQASGS
jgi:hypothetical protein